MQTNTFAKACKSWSHIMRVWVAQRLRLSTRKVIPGGVFSMTKNESLLHLWRSSQDRENSNACPLPAFFFFFFCKAKTAFKFTAPLPLSGNKRKPNSAGNPPSLTGFYSWPKAVCIELVQMFADKHCSFGSGHFKLSPVFIFSPIECHV